mmetsp:Transcript_3414/g.5035  ORF Transcript_3414/g.5035 Transcript_3414/m.5035 type:complete len:237 (+) Transcript_3414:341-1051(+)
MEALPPSNLPIGNRFTEELYSPANPTRNKPWIGIGCDSGASITFGNTMLAIDPIKKLDFIKAAGTTGKYVNDCAVMVSRSPKTIMAIDASIATPGPLIAISNRADLLDGNDLKGVILPKLPTCRDGSGTGFPSLTPYFFAATMCITSCNAEIANTPKNTGRQSGNEVVSLSLTIALKNEGFSAKELTAYATVVNSVISVENTANDLVVIDLSDSCSGTASFAKATITGGGLSSLAP